MLPRDSVIGGLRLPLKSSDRLTQRKDFLSIAIHAADGNRLLLGLAAADGHQHGHLGEAVMTYLIADFFVRHIRLHTQAGELEGRGCPGRRGTRHSQ